MKQPYFDRVSRLWIGFRSIEHRPAPLKRTLFSKALEPPTRSLGAGASQAQATPDQPGVKKTDRQTDRETDRQPTQPACQEPGKQAGRQADEVIEIIQIKRGEVNNFKTLN